MQDGRQVNIFSDTDRSVQPGMPRFNSRVRELFKFKSAQAPEFELRLPQGINLTMSPLLLIGHIQNEARFEKFCKQKGDNDDEDPPYRLNSPVAIPTRFLPPDSDSDCDIDEEVKQWGRQLAAKFNHLSYEFELQIAAPFPTEVVINISRLHPAGVGFIKVQCTTDYDLAFHKAEEVIKQINDYDIPTIKEITIDLASASVTTSHYPHYLVSTDNSTFLNSVDSQLMDHISILRNYLG